jgi:hypothetical protein
MKKVFDQKNMYSPDMFQPETQTSVFSVQTGNWVGHLIKGENGSVTARKTTGEELIFSDEERAKAFLRNEKEPLYKMTEEEWLQYDQLQRQKENTNQISLFA